jgi:hypothetical protein
LIAQAPEAKVFSMVETQPRAMALARAKRPSRASSSNARRSTPTVDNLSPTDDLAQAALAALARAGLRTAKDACKANTRMMITVEGKVQHISPEEHASLSQVPQQAPA